MTSRVLPPEEWHRLIGTEAEGVPFPVGSLPVVIERDGEIIACQVLMPFWHLECGWVAPAYRKTMVFGRLWAAVRAECAKLDIGAVCTASMTDDVKALIGHMQGVPLPGEHFVVPVRKSCHL